MHALPPKRKLFRRLMPATLMLLSIPFSGCRTSQVEMGDRLRKGAPGDVLPALVPPAKCWVFMDDVRFKQFIEKIGTP